MDPYYIIFANYFIFFQYQGTVEFKSGFKSLDGNNLWSILS